MSVAFNFFPKIYFEKNFLKKDTSFHYITETNCFFLPSNEIGMMHCNCMVPDYKKVKERVL